MRHSDLLRQYDEMQRLSLQMLDAARKNDWDRLTELGQTRTVIMDDIKRQDIKSWGGTDAIEKERLIRTILAADVEIRTLSKSYMEELQRILGRISNTKKLQKMYG